MRIYTVLSEPLLSEKKKKNSVSPDEKPQNMVPQKGMYLILEMIFE